MEDFEFDESEESSKNIKNSTSASDIFTFVLVLTMLFLVSWFCTYGELPWSSFGKDTKKQNYENSNLKKVNDFTVYVTKTGSKYHLAGCKYLEESSSPMRFQDAFSEGYRACEYCIGE